MTMVKLQKKKYQNYFRVTTHYELQYDEVSPKCTEKIEKMIDFDYWIVFNKYNKQKIIITV